MIEGGHKDPKLQGKRHSLFGGTSGANVKGSRLSLMSGNGHKTRGSVLTRDTEPIRSKINLDSEKVDSGRGSMA